MCFFGLRLVCVMKKNNSHTCLATPIDKITKSIERRVDGVSHPTVVVSINTSNSSLLLPVESWKFDWSAEILNSKRFVYGLVLKFDTSRIQGLMSVEIKADHMHIHLLESGVQNIGKRKQYLGVPGNLIAFACLQAIELGMDGSVAFYAKTGLINHYSETLGAKFIGGQLMVIYPENALFLIAQYRPKQL
jgi:hypothetical protein